MMPAIHHRTDEWRAGQCAEGFKARNLWAAVVLNALNEAAHDVRKLRAKGEPSKAETVIQRFRVWAKSRDGREVLECAGIQHSERVVEGMCRAVSNGRFSAYALRGGAQNGRQKNAA